VCFMQRMKVLALCVAVLLTFSGLVSAKQGFDIKASVLFGTKLDVDDVVIGADEGTATMEWVSKGDPEATLGEDGDPVGYDNFDLVVSCELGRNAKKVAISPEETGYPMLLEATYGMDKFQIGGFWLGGFKSEGEVTGTVSGLGEEGLAYHDLEVFVFYPIRNNSSIGHWDSEQGAYVHNNPDTNRIFAHWNPIDQSTSMVFLGDVPVLPGMHYDYTLALEVDSTDIFNASGGYVGLPDASPILEVDPEQGASTWEADVAFNLSNYGGNVGYKLFDQDNVSVAFLAGLEQLKWQEEINGTAVEIYDIIVNEAHNLSLYRENEVEGVKSYVLQYEDSSGDLIDVESTVEQDAYLSILKKLYGENTTDVVSALKERGLIADDADIATDDALKASLVDIYLVDRSGGRNSQLSAIRDLKVTRELDYSPTGYSVGANVGGIVADKLRVSASFSLGWFSGDAVAKLTVEEKRSAGVTNSQYGTETWVVKTSEDIYEEVPYNFEKDIDPLELEYFERLEEGMNDMPIISETTEKKHTDTEVTLTKAQVSAEYDVTDSVFLGGGFFYSQWKDMPVLSNKSALEIEKQDLVASGVNVEVGVRF
jgi:hypothetical protein